MSLEEYLHQKKIDAAALKSAEPKRFEEWETVWKEVHPNSFTSQKLYLINRIRRKYPWTGPTGASATPAPARNKPVIKPKMG